MSIYKNFSNSMIKRVVFQDWQRRCFHCSAWALQSTKNAPREIQRRDDNKQISKDVKLGERIKQTSKDATNLTVVLGGLGVTCFIMWVIFKEFFSSKSPSGVFSAALKKCKQDPRVVQALGEPIKGHGEMTRRGRARHVSSVEYEKNGHTYIRVKFYLKGPFATATAEAEKDTKSSDFRYLFVQKDIYPNDVIVVEDNRMLERMETTTTVRQ